MESGSRLNERVNDRSREREREEKQDRGGGGTRQNRGRLLLTPTDAGTDQTPDLNTHSYRTEGPEEERQNQ